MSDPAADRGIATGLLASLEILVSWPHEPTSPACAPGAPTPMNGLNLRERRLIAVALLLGLIAAIWLGMVSPLIAGFQARDAERQSLLATYQRNQRLLDGVPAWRAQAETLKHSVAGFAVTAPSKLQAQELLKQRLAGVLTVVGGATSGVQDVQTALPTGWIGARADAQLTLPQLTDSLRRLQNEEPYVVVEYLSLNADRASRSGHAGPLDVRIEIATAFRQTDEVHP